MSSLMASTVIAASLISPAMADLLTGEAALKTGTAGVGPLMDAIANLVPKSGIDGDSWYVTGDFTAAGQKMHYLYHATFAASPAGPVITQKVSITNSTTGVFRSASTTTPMNGGATVDPSSLNIVTPTGSLSGNFDDMHVAATMEGGKFDLHLRAASPAIYNGGTGMFPLVGTTTYEYAVPRMITTGTVTLDGATFSLAPGSANSWFDRQWLLLANINGPLRWTWMGLNLSNGDSLSIWGINDAALGKDRAFATILHTDGSQSVVAAQPGLGAANFWTSSVSGNRYASSWTVQIPQLNTKLKVTAEPANQEIIETIGPGNFMGSSVVGTYRGVPVTGTGRVEMVGTFK